jgi:hypothetical protein
LIFTKQKGGTFWRDVGGWNDWLPMHFRGPK